VTLRVCRNAPTALQVNTQFKHGAESLEADGAAAQGRARAAPSHAEWRTNKLLQLTGGGRQERGRGRAVGRCEWWSEVQTDEAPQLNGACSLVT